jgi:hypothetical protein
LLKEVPVQIHGCSVSVQLSSVAAAAHWLLHVGAAQLSRRSSSLVVAHCSWWGDKWDDCMEIKRICRRDYLHTAYLLRTNL